MAIEKEINLNVNSNIEGSIGELKALKRELKGVDVGTAEFKKLYNQIDDLEDKIKSAKNKSSDWIDSLQNAGGPLGMVGTGLNSLKVSTQSFGAALKATGIGIIVLALTGLAAAFAQNDNAMKKLKPLMDGMQKILQGIFRAVEPLLDAFLDLAMKALPYVTQGIGLFYSALVGLFTLVKEVGGGYIKMMKGIVTLDFDAAKEGFNQIKDGFSKAVKSGEEAYARFQAGSKEQTASEKDELAKRREEQKKHQEELAKKQKEASDKAAEERKRAAEEARKAEEDRRKAELDLEKKYIDELQGLNAKTDQEKLDLQAQKDLEEINRIAKTANEKANLMALYNEKYTQLNQELDDKQKAIDDKTATDKKAKDEKDAADYIKLQEDKAKADKALADAKKAILVNQLEETAKTLNGIADLFGKQTAVGKTAAVASATIETFLSAQKAYTATVGIPIVGPVLAPINAGLAIAAGFKNIKSILAVPTPDGGGGGSVPSAPSAPAAPSFNVVGNSGVNQVANVMSNQGMQPVQAYVVANNVTTAQGLNRNIVNNATLG
jgi:membrane protein involved in colicin uptake